MACPCRWIVALLLLCGPARAGEVPFLHPDLPPGTTLFSITSGPRTTLIIGTPSGRPYASLAFDVEGSHVSSVDAYTAGVARRMGLQDALYREMLRNPAIQTGKSYWAYTNWSTYREALEDIKVGTVATPAERLRAGRATPSAQLWARNGFVLQSVNEEGGVRFARAPRLSLPVVAQPVVTHPDICFAAGTLVATETGARSIERIRVGERVWSYDETTREWALKPVVDTIVNPPAPVLAITWRVGEAVEQVRVTPSHPFLTDEGQWLVAEDLVAGTTLVTRSGERGVVLSNRPRAAVEPVFNLEVEEFHTYVVGRAGVVVHNLCARDPTAARYQLNRMPRAGTLWLLSGVAVALHAGQHGAIPAAVGFAEGVARGVVFSLATRTAVAGLTAIGLQGAAKVLGRTVPLVGQALLVGDIALTVANLLVGANAGWGDVWDAFLGKLDRPTYVAGPAPAPDQGAYVD